MKKYILNDNKKNNRKKKKIKKRDLDVIRLEKKVKYVKKTHLKSHPSIYKTLHKLISSPPPHTTSKVLSSSKKQHHTHHDNPLQEEPQEERTRERRTRPYREAQEASWRSRKRRRHAPPPYPLRQVPSWLLRQGGYEVFPQTP